MLIVVPQEAVELIRRCKDDLLLGIITQGGVELTIADRVVTPGHVPWLRRTPRSDVTGGFSLMVRDGLVVGFFRTSELNPTRDGLLSEELALEIAKALPMAPGTVVYRH